MIDEQTNTALLTHTLGDILTSGLVGRVEVVPWLLTQLVEKLKKEVSQLSPLVPDDFYLPAPPLYCPQPSTADKVCFVNNNTHICRVPGLLFSKQP